MCCKEQMRPTSTIQAVYEFQGRKTKRGSCPVCETAAGVDEAECMEFCLGMDKKPNEGLWIRIKKQSKGDIIVGVCYRLPDQEELEDQACRQKGAASLSPALIFNRDLRNNTLTSAGGTMHQDRS